MTRFAVFGGGMMGGVIAKDLLDSSADASVDVLDSSSEHLAEAADWNGPDRIQTRQVDASSQPDTIAALRDYDVVIGALPHRFSLGLVEACIEAGTSLVDLVGERPEERKALHDKARDAGCTVIPGCGVAPGISNLCVGHGMELLDATENAYIYVGGLPKRREPPLYYQTVYLLESVFNAYRRPPRVQRVGKLVEVEPLSGQETVVFPELMGALEAFYTDGLGSLAITVADRISGDLFEKTLRYPGHRDRIRFLMECGLLEDEPVEVDGEPVSPIALLVRVLEKKLVLGPEGDILALRVRVEGRAGGDERAHEFDLFDMSDPRTGHTATSRATGFTAAGAARRIASGEIGEKGVWFPEELFLGDRFESLVDELASKGVRVRHEVIEL